MILSIDTEYPPDGLAPELHVTTGDTIKFNGDLFLGFEPDGTVKLGIADTCDSCFMFLTRKQLRNLIKILDCAEKEGSSKPIVNKLNYPG